VVYVNGEPYGSGTGRSKKSAETHAAAQAWTALDSSEAEGAEGAEAGAAELDA
jgi:dsRNA-specific ribonuclease